MIDSLGICHLKMRRISFVVAVFALLGMASCASTDEEGLEGSFDKSSQNDGANGSKASGKTGSKPDASGESTKKSASRTSGATKFVLSALGNEAGIEGAIGVETLAEVVAALEELTRKEPDNAPLLVTYVGLLRMYGPGQSLYRAAEQSAGMVASKNPWFMLEAGYAAIRRKEYGLADYLFDRAEKSATETAAKNAITHARGVRLYLSGKTRDGILTMRRAALAQTPYLPALLTLGFLALKANDVQGAETMFKQATALASGSVNARLGLAASVRAQGRPDEAIALLSELQKQHPKERRLAWNLALALAESNSESQKEASALLNKYFQMPGSLPDIDNKASALMTKMQTVKSAQAPAKEGAAATDN